MGVIKNELENSVYEMLTELKKPTWHDYIDSNGDIHQNVQAANVMVKAQDDLASLTDYEPGTVAFTAGFKNVWQKKADGTWESLL